MNFVKAIAALCFTLAVAAAAPASAEDDEMRTAVAELLDVMQVEKQITQLMGPMTQQFMQVLVPGNEEHAAGDAAAGHRADANQQYENSSRIVS